MPTYVYKNITTGETFELQQSIKDDALKVDPNTGDPVIRVIQPVGIAFKGSGFYVNDSKSNNPVSGPKPSEGSEASTETSSNDASSGTETKTGAKTETKSEAKSSKESSTTTSTKKESKSKAKSKAKTS